MVRIGANKQNGDLGLPTAQKRLSTSPNLQSFPDPPVVQRQREQVRRWHIRGFPWPSEEALPLSRGREIQKGDPQVVKVLVKLCLSLDIPLPWGQ